MNRSNDVIIKMIFFRWQTDFKFNSTMSQYSNWQNQCRFRAWFWCRPGHYQFNGKVSRWDWYRNGGSYGKNQNFWFFLNFFGVFLNFLGIIYSGADNLRYVQGARKGHDNWGDKINWKTRRKKWLYNWLIWLTTRCVHFDYF